MIHPGVGLWQSSALAIRRKEEEEAKQAEEESCKYYVTELAMQRDGVQVSQKQQSQE